VTLSKVERFSEFDSRPRPIIRLYKPVVIIYLKGNVEAYETYAGIDKYRHIVGAAFYYLINRSFRRIFVERIMHWRKSYEANLAEWEATMSYAGQRSRQNLMNGSTIAVLKLPDSVTSSYQALTVGSRLPFL